MVPVAQQSLAAEKQIVDDRDRTAALQQHAGQQRADIPRAAGDQDVLALEKGITLTAQLHCFPVHQQSPPVIPPTVIPVSLFVIPVFLQ